MLRESFPPHPFFLPSDLDVKPTKRKQTIYNIHVILFVLPSNSILFPSFHIRSDHNDVACWTSDVQSMLKRLAPGRGVRPQDNSMTFQASVLCLLTVFVTRPSQQSTL